VAFTIKGTRYYDPNGDPNVVKQAEMQALKVSSFQVTEIQALTLDKYQVFSEVTYTVTTCALKVSIALLLLLLSQKRRYTYILRISIAVICIYSIVCLFLTLFQCNPVQLAWGDLPFCPSERRNCICVFSHGYCY
jgi:hypothetical protein